MDIALFTELITTLGFPIAIVIAMGYFIYKIYKKSEEREDKLMDSLKECREVNADAIATIAKYAGTLDIIQKDIADIKTEITILTNEQE